MWAESRLFSAPANCTHNYYCVLQFNVPFILESRSGARTPWFSKANTSPLPGSIIYICKISRNVVLPSVLRYTKWSFSKRFPSVHLNASDGTAVHTEWSGQWAGVGRPRFNWPDVCETVACLSRVLASHLLLCHEVMWEKQSSTAPLIPSLDSRWSRVANFCLPSHYKVLRSAPLAVTVI